MKEKVYNFKNFALMTSTSAFVHVPMVAAADCEEGGLSDGVECVSEGVAFADRLFGDGGAITNIINTMLFLIGIISVIMLIIGGLRYVISGGDQTAVQNAKNTILYAIVGLIISLLALAIVQFVTGRLE